MNDRTFSTSRILPFSQEKVHKAWTTPELLATWWGPAGFTNIFEVCDIVTGGEWKFIMRSAEGIEYPNLSTWIEVEQDHVCIEHLNAPHFLMRADFKTIRPNSTEIIWTGTFDTPEIFAALKPIIIPANEQNLDRLEMCLNTL